MPPALRFSFSLRPLPRRFPIQNNRHPLHLHLRHHASAPTSRSSTFPNWRPILLAIGKYLTWIPGIAFCWTHIFQIATVTGPSMYPFLNTSYNTSTTRDRIWMSMWNPAADLQRGMVVAFWGPHRPEALVLKRIVAIEGDRVKTRGRYPLEYVDVPVGHVWVEGDNVEKGGDWSWDSNYYGPVSKSLIVGKVVGVVWPLARSGRIRWQDWKGSERVMEGVNKVERIEFY